MCGRFSLVDPRTVFERFGVRPPPDLKPRYNIAPGQFHPVIVSEPGGLAARAMRWGLIPSWAKDPAIGYKTINARSESVAEKPAFRDSFRKRRCLVPGDGFYEWRTLAGTTRRIPMRFVVSDGTPFCFAGLWSSWKPEDAEPVETFTILTAAADGVFSPVHDREPVILPDEYARRWLDPAADLSALQVLLKPLPAERLRGYEVSTVVNAAAHDVPACVEPAGPLQWPQAKS